VTDDRGSQVLARAPRVQALLERVRDTPLSLDGVYLVGGAVRDALLGVDAGPDIDLAVEGDGPAFARLLASASGGNVELVHDAFGTATVIVDLGEDWGVTEVDVASCRTERYAEPGALPQVMLGATIEQDLVRRDATLNAIAVALSPNERGEHRLVDEHDGIEDLRHGLLRVLHDASFVDDPTRIFRVARYAGRTGLRVDEHTRALAIEAVAGGALATISAERVRTELQLVLGEHAWNALTLLASWGVVDRLDPRLEEAFHPPLLLRAIDEACGHDPARNRRAWQLRLAALARPLAGDAAGWMQWLGFPGDVVAAACEHLRVLDAVLERGDALRAMPNSQLYVELGDVSDDSLALVALAIGDADPALLERLVTFAAAARDTRLAVRGEDVLAAGVPAGPRIGSILGDLFLRSLDGELQGEADERRALAEHARDAADQGDEHA
jgi:tRNA nucleotidyltransferase (CCA-adding enzyme)